MKKAFLNWSSGKDSALALYYTLQKEDFKVEKLFTTISTPNDRVSMHGVRLDLLEQQAINMNIQLKLAYLEENSGMAAYNMIIKGALVDLKNEGFTHSIYGDIFLEDLREYREEQLAEVGLSAEFPLWEKDTVRLMKEFIELGFKAIVVSTNSKYLDDSFCGRVIDHEFLKDLPKNVDPCGENGEFHTFVYDGPVFSNPVKFEIGEMVNRAYSASKEESDDCFKDNVSSWDTRFCFCDLIPL